MGRPISKRFIGNTVGSIRVTNHFFTGASESSANAFIVKQRGVKRFEVSDGTTTELLTLVNKNAGSLAAGEMRISGITDASTVVNITKLRNRSIQHSGTITANIKAGTNTKVTRTGLEFSSSTDQAVSIDVLSVTV